MSASRNPRMENVPKKMHLTREEKEALISETLRKKKFVTEIKELVDGTNFSVGTEDPNFDRKEIATVDNPDYKKVIVSPRPHKNNSTLKIKYDQSSTFARPDPHSETMNINRMNSTILSLTDRPRFLSHLKKGSLKFNPDATVKEHS